MATCVKTIERQHRVHATAQSPPLPWKPLAWFASLLLVCYASVLYGLVRQWATDEDMGHGFLVPLVAGYIAWKRWPELTAVARRANAWGLVLVVWGAAQMILGNLAAQIFITRTAFLLSLAGIVLYAGGSRSLRILAFPLLLTIFLFPLPAILYARITLPLQIFASSVAEAILNFAGIPVLRDGNILELARHRISVVEACSGMRSLLSLSFLALVYAYFFDQKVWMRGLLFAGTIPIAIAANAARVTLAGLISDWRPELAQGLFHTLEGWVLFLVAMLLLVALHRLANRSYALVQKRGLSLLSGVRKMASAGPLPHGRGSVSSCKNVDTFLGRARQQAVFGLFPHLTSLPTFVLSSILVLQGSLFYGFSRGEAVAFARSLDGFPSAVRAWRMIEQGVIEKDVRDVLRADDYLTRRYAISPAQTASLFVASFKSQRAGQTPHSPKNCLPGSGWMWSVSDTLRVNIAERDRPIEINRYVVSKGDMKAVVLYWYQSRDRVVASEYKAAAFVAWDAIRRNRTDTALVRVVVPIAGNRADAATQRGIEFIQAFFTTLRQFLPA